MTNIFQATQMALANAKTKHDYETAKLTAAKLPASEQYQIVDHFISCRARLVSEGVL